MSALTFDAEHLRAALAVATFAYRTDDLPALACVRLTVRDGVMWAQATDRFVAAVYRGPGVENVDLDVLLPGADALRVAKQLRTARDSVAVTQEPARWLLDAVDRKPAPIVGVISGVSAVGDRYEYPKVSSLMGRGAPSTAVTLNPALTAPLAAWQKAAGGQYDPGQGITWEPLILGDTESSHFATRVTVPRTHEPNVGLVAYLMGTRDADRDSRTIGDAAREAALGLLADVPGFTS